MAKSIAASLLLGAAAVIAGLLLYFFATSPDQPASPLILDAAAARVEVGGVLPGREPQFLTQDNGMGVVTWSMAAAQAGSYAYLRLQFYDSQLSAGLSVFWKTAATGEQIHSYRAVGSLAQEEWIPLARSGAWHGAITELGLIINGKPQQLVHVQSVGLMPDTVFTRVRVMLAHWLTPTSWNHSSINVHPGVRYDSAAIPPPLPVFTLWLALSLMWYQLFRRWNPGLNWPAVACIFLVCWLSLDLLWQRNLLLQLRETHSVFAGKSEEGKRLAGPDESLFELVTDAKKLMPSSASRVFVVSGDDYRGMRGAYYAYPQNVYWRRKGRKLPEPEAIQSDDYILVLPPVKLRYNSHENILESPDGNTVPVELLISRQIGALFRVL